MTSRKMRRKPMPEPRYLFGDDYAYQETEGNEEVNEADTGLPDRMWEDED